MTKRLAAAALLPALAVFALAAAAQTPALPSYTQGDTTVIFRRFHNTPTTTLLSGGVTLTAPDYDLKALTVEFFASPASQGGDRGGLEKIVAEADLAHHVQVVGHFRQEPAQPPDSTGQSSTGVDHGRYYTVYADHAVYVPDKSRADAGSPDLTGHPSGTLDLIGHPKIIGLAPDILQGPSTTTFNDPTAVVHVLLGKAPDYPQVEGPAGQTDFVPLH